MPDLTVVAESFKNSDFFQDCWFALRMSVVILIAIVMESRNLIRQINVLDFNYYCNSLSTTLLHSTAVLWPRVLSLFTKMCSCLNTKQKHSFENGSLSSDRISY